LPSYSSHPISMMVSCRFHPLHRSTCQSLIPSTSAPNIRREECHDQQGWTSMSRILTIFFWCLSSISAKQIL
jgi:hypothetical protein